MNNLLANQNDLLAAYLYASQQLLVVNEFEERWPAAFSRMGEELGISRIYVYEQEQLENGDLRLWHQYSWHADPAAIVVRDPKDQGLIYKKGTLHNRWKDIVNEEGYMAGITTDFSAEDQLHMEVLNILSILLIPIYIEKEIWGVIGFDDCEHERAWTTVEINILKGLAAMIGTAIENGRLYQAEQKARQRAELIRDLSRLIGQNMSRADIVQRILQKLKQIITFDTSSIYLVPRGGEPEFITVSGFTDQETTMREAKQLLKNSPILYKMSQDLQSIISPDVRQLDGWIWVPGASDLRSFIAAPMVYRKKMIGTLMLDSKQVDFFQENDLHVIETLAQHIAISLENARLFDRAQQELAQKTAILKASTAVSSSLSLTDILTELARQLGKGVDATSAYIVQLRPDTETAVIVAEYITPNLPNHKFIGGLNTVYSFPHDFIGDTTWLDKGIPYARHIDDPDMTEEGRRHFLKYDGKSILSLPLIIKGKAFGYAQLWQCSHRQHFTEQQISLCVGIAQQAAIAFENSALFAKQERQLQLSKTLQQVGSLLTVSLKLNELYENIFNLLAQVVEYDTVSLQLINENGTNAYYEIGRGFDDDNIAEKFINTVSHHSLKKVAASPHWMIINDTETSSEWISAPPPLDRTRSWIGAALIAKDKIIGILNVDHHHPYAYTTAMGETVAAFANQAAIAVENNRLYHEVGQHINELTILHRVAETTATIVDQDDLLHMTTEMIVQAMPYKSFGIAFISAEEPDFLIPHRSAYGFPIEPQTIRVPIDASVMGKAIRSGHAVVILNTHDEPLHYTATDRDPMHSEVAVPINIRGEPIGVVYVAHPDIGKFGEEDVRFLTTLAGQLSAAMERARLYKGLQQQTQILAQQVTHRTAELQRERDRTIAILENAGESIIITGIDNLVSYVNPAMERLSGYTRAELIGQHPRLWRSPHTSKMVYAEMSGKLVNGRSWRGELVNIHKNGTEYDVLMSITPLTENGKIVGYVSMQADIGRLKELDRLKSKFVSNVSHELRTPMTNIKTYLTLLERGKPEKRERYMGVMHHEVDRLERLLQDLLDISRLDAASSPVNLPAIDLIAVMKQYFSVLSVKAQANQIEHAMTLPDMPLRVKITTEHAGKLFTNLINNALTHTPENGRITLHVDQDSKDGKKYVRACIRDNGTGIEPEDLPHVFERFYRGKGKHGSNIPGTGLGLAICKEIVERYDGSISIDSTWGEETAVTVWLPIAPASELE